MSKKLFLLIVILIFIPGCSGTYKLEVYNEKIIEKTTFLYSIFTLDNEDPYEYTKKLAIKYKDNGDFLSANKKRNIKKKNKIGFELTKTHENVGNYVENSKFVNACYIARNITSYDNDFITLKTSKEFTCFEQVEELENVTIAIKSNHKLKETNADETKGHTYYWHINKDNYKDKPISLVLYTDKFVWNYDNEILKRLFLIIFVIGGTVLVSRKVYNIYKEKEDL